MLVRVRGVEGDFILENDAIDQDDFAKAVREIKMEWMKPLIVKSENSRGKNFFQVNDSEGNMRYQFSPSESYEHILDMCVDDISFYIKIPMELIREKMLVKGFVCRCTKLSSKTYMI